MTVMAEQIKLKYSNNVALLRMLHCSHVIELVIMRIPKIPRAHPHITGCMAVVMFDSNRDLSHARILA